MILSTPAPRGNASRPRRSVTNSPGIDAGRIRGVEERPTIFCCTLGGRPITQRRRTTILPICSFFFPRGRRRRPTAQLIRSHRRIFTFECSRAVALWRLPENLTSTRATSTLLILLSLLNLSSPAISIAISATVCLSVCSLAHLRSQMSTRHEI